MNESELVTRRPIPTDPEPERPQAPVFYVKFAKPFWSYILIGANVVVFLAMIAYGLFRYGTFFTSGTIADSYILFDFGMKVNALIAQGEVWRLFTAMFLHLGVMHLLFNLYALYILGPMVEGYFGRWRFLAVYFLGGLFGSLASYAFSPNPSAGASGAVFALVGANIVYFLKFRDNFGERGRAILQNMIVVTVINLAFGLSVSGVDNWGHMGGLIGGIVVAWGMLPNYERPQIVKLGPQPLTESDRSSWYAIWTAAVLGLMWTALQFANQVTPI
jgi:rhomboid protease GluP